MSGSTASLDPDDLDIFEGTILGEYFRVEALLGEGSYGFVTKCRHTTTNKAVAVKVNKNHPKILEQAKKELFIVDKLRSLDPESSNIVQWHGSFLDEGRICLNFELLDQSLGAFLEERRNKGLPITELRPVLYQLTNALSHLSSMGIIHADLKPDNIMIVDRYQSPLTVKVIDFGLSCPVSAVIPGDSVQTIWYRAPEVMLCAPFNQAIDMWSLGLIAVELATGWPLYPGEMNYDVLRFIIDTQGQLPDCVLERGFETHNFFVKQNEHWTFKSEEQFQHETGRQPEETRSIRVKNLDAVKQLMQTGHQSDQDLLVKLIKQMLHLDADQRIQPLEVLRHPFFKPSLSTSSPREPWIETENTEAQILVLSQQPSSWQSRSSNSVD